MYGYGAGAGTGGVGDTSTRGEGGGGGGGVRAVPVGVIEVSDQPTRFVPISDRKKLAGAVLAGVVVGIWVGLGGRRRPGRVARARVRKSVFEQNSVCANKQK